MARIAKTSLSLDNPDYSDFRALMRKEEELLLSTAAAYREKYRGDMVGEVVQWPRADGYARYMVMSQRPLTLQHIAVGDAWQVEAALIRGTTIDDVRVNVAGQRKIAEMFGSQPPARDFT